MRGGHRRFSWLAIPAMAVLVAGCAYQDPLSLPPLERSHGSSSVYYGSGAYGYGYGYGPYYDPRFGYSYRRYDPRFGYDAWGNPYYYYGPGAAVPYPRPGYTPYPRGPWCIDRNRDGRCDGRRPGDGHDNSGRGDHDGGGKGPGDDGRPRDRNDDRSPIELLRDGAREQEQRARGRTPPAAAVIPPAETRRQAPAATLQPGSTRHVQRPAEPVRRVEPVRQAEPVRRVDPLRQAEPARRAEPARQAEPARRASPPPARVRTNDVDASTPKPPPRAPRQDEGLNKPLR